MNTTPQVRSTGILLYPPLENGPNGFSLSYHDSNEQLRFFLLYFDQICLVPLNFTGMPSIFCSSEEEQLAAKQGLVSFVWPRIVVTGETNENLLRQDISRVFRLMNSGENGHWALAVPPGFRTDAEVSQWNAATAVLRDVLPSPSAEVPLSDIIDFKNQNAEAVRNLLFAIDEIFVSLQFDDSSRRDLVERKIKEAVQAVEQELKRAAFPYARVGLSFSKVIESGVLAPLLEAAGTAIGTPPILGSLLGGAVTVTARRSSLARHSNRYPTDFEYLYLGSKMKVIGDGGETGTAKPVHLRPTSYLSSIASSYLPKDIVPEREHGGFQASHNTSIVPDIHTPQELGTYFQGWAQYHKHDDDEELDAR